MQFQEWNREVGCDEAESGYGTSHGATTRHSSLISLRSMLVLPSIVTSEDELRLAQAVERLAASHEEKFTPCPPCSAGSEQYATLRENGKPCGGHHFTGFRALSDARNDRTEPEAGEYVPRPSSAKVYWWQKGGAA